MKIAIIGMGMGADTLLPAILKSGHDVVIGVHHPADLSYAGTLRAVAVRSMPDAASWAEIIVLRINWDAYDDAFRAIGSVGEKLVIYEISARDLMNDLPLLNAPFQRTARMIGSIDMLELRRVDRPRLADMIGSADRVSEPVPMSAFAKVKLLQLFTDLGFDVRDAGPLQWSSELQNMARLVIAQAFSNGKPGMAWAMITRDA